MKADAIHALAELARNAGNPKIVSTNTPEPPHVYFIRNEKTGAMEQFTAQPHPRGHALLDVESVVQLAADQQALSAASGAEKEIALYYSREGVVAVLDDSTRRDRASLKLALSPQFKTISGLDGTAQRWKQADFVHLLRVRLAGAFAETHPSLIESLRAVKIRRSEDGGSEIIQGKASIGRSLQAEIQGREPVPEVVTLLVPVFHGHDWTARVVCALDIDPTQSETPFQLQPLAGEVERALRVAEELLRQEIERQVGKSGLRAPLYYGAP